MSSVNSVAAIALIAMAMAACQSEPKPEHDRGSSTEQPAQRATDEPADPVPARERGTESLDPTASAEAANMVIPGAGQVRRELEHSAIVDTPFGDQELLAFIDRWYPKHEVQQLRNGYRFTPSEPGDAIIVAAWHRSAYRLTVVRAPEPDGDERPSAGRVPDVEGGAAAAELPGPVRVPPNAPTDEAAADSDSAATGPR